MTAIAPTTAVCAGDCGRPVDLIRTHVAIVRHLERTSGGGCIEVLHAANVAVYHPACEPKDGAR